MKQRLSILALFIVGCVVGGVGAQLVKAPPARAGTNPARWDHYCFHVGIDDAGKPVNDASNQGWELVGTSTIPGALGSSETLFCFKRPH